MNKYLLGTNICIHFFKNEYNIPVKIKEKGLENCYISEITLLELFFGAENSNEKYKKNNYQKVKIFEQIMENRVVPISACIEIYAKEKTRLRAQGKFPGEFDLIIGSTAVANQMILVTRNIKHFKDISGIQLENWIDE